MPERVNRDSETVNRNPRNSAIRDTRFAVDETILAFDYGERFLGVAVAETGVGIAHPLATIDATGAAPRFAAVSEVIREWRPARLVVGLPLSPAGEDQALTARVRRFARRLAGRFGLPVVLQDERLSSAEAESRLRAIGRGGRRHKDLTHPVAAQVVLQAYLDENPR